MWLSYTVAIAGSGFRLDNHMDVHVIRIARRYDVVNKGYFRKQRSI